MESSAENTTSTATRTHPFDVKFTAGVALSVNEKMSFGLSADMIYLANEAGEACIEVKGAGQNFDDCDDDLTGDAFDIFQASLYLKFRL